MKQYVANFTKFMPLLHDLVMRDIKVKYRRSVLGLIWSILNPLLMMLVITAVFSTIFKQNVPNFPIYYLTGSVIFSFFSEATTGALGSVFGSGALIKKVYLPKYLFAFEKVLFAFVNLLFSLIAVVIMMIVTTTPVTWTILLAPIALVYAFVFCIGVGLVLATVATFFRDMVHLYGVFITALTYFTPIFYPVSIIPENIRWLLHFNPLVHFIDYFRQCVLYGTVPNIKANIYCMIISLGALLVGALVFKKNQDKFILYI